MRYRLMAALLACVSVAGAQEWLIEYKPEGETRIFRQDGGTIITDSLVSWDTMYPDWSQNVILPGANVKLGSQTTNASASMIGRIRVRVTYLGPHGYTAAWVRTDAFARWAGGTDGYASDGLGDQAEPIPLGEESDGSRIVRYPLVDGQAEFSVYLSASVTKNTPYGMLHISAGSSSNITSRRAYLTYNNKSTYNAKKITGNMLMGDHGLQYPEAVPETKFIETSPSGFVNFESINLGLQIGTFNQDYEIVLPHTDVDFVGSATYEGLEGEEYEWSSSLNPEGSFSQTLPDEGEWFVRDMLLAYQQPIVVQQGPNYVMTGFEYGESRELEFIDFTYRWADGAEANSQLRLIFHPGTDNYIEYGRYYEPEDPNARYSEGIAHEFASGGPWAPNTSDTYQALANPKEFEWWVLFGGSSAVTVAYSAGWIALPEAALIVAAAGMVYTLIDHYLEDEEIGIARTFAGFQRACAVGDVNPIPLEVTPSWMTAYDWHASDKQLYDYIHRYGDKWNIDGYVGQVLESEQVSNRYQRLFQFQAPGTDFGGGGGS